MALTKVTGSVIKDSVSLSGNVSVGGTLTYQDVTNVDALGIGTFRTGIDITGGNLTIPDKIIHSGDTNTAIRFPAADTITAETAGTERLRITSSGEVKIMNTSGTVGLYFQSSSGAVSNFRAIGTNNQSLGYFFGNTEKVRFDSSGRVGIGTETPDSILAIEGTGSDNNTRITIKDGTGIAEVNGRYGNLILDSDRDNAVSGSVMTFQVDGSERLRITAAGSVNIGGNYTQTTYKAQITTGTNKHISFTNAAHDDLSNEGSAIIFSRQNDGSKELSGIFGHSNSSLGIAARTDITLHAGGTSNYGSAPERLRIASDGNVGINQTNPNKAKLHVVADSGSTDKIVAKFRNPQGSADVKAKIGFVAGYSDTANDTEGQAYIGAQRESNGNNAALFFETSDGSTLTERMRIENSGISGTIKNNYALVAFITDRDDGSRSTGSTSYQDDTGLVLTNAVTYRHGDILFVKANCPTGVALVSSNTANYQGVGVRIRITPSSGTTRYSNETRGWYRNDGPATKETMQLSTTIYHLIASNTSQFSDNVTLSFQVQYRRDPGGTGSYGAVGLSNWSGERTLEVWQFRKQL